MLSRNIRQRLRELSKQFTEQLPNRLQSIADGVEQLRSDSDTPSALVEIRMQAHRLAGTGSSFGFNGISAAARELETAADAAMNGDRGVAEEKRRAVEDAYTALRRSVRAEVVEDADDAALAEEVSNLLPLQEEQESSGEYAGHQVALLAGADETLGDLPSQLGFFGFPVRTLDELAELETLLEERHGGVVILIADLAEIPDQEDVALHLRALRNDNNPLAGIIFFSGLDNFDERLRAVRSGGDAFFPAPVEVLRLVDKLETILGTAHHDPYHVLVVDDDHEQVSYLALILQQAGMITSVVTEANNVFQVLTEAKPELILMDMYMPGCSGIELARIIRQQEAFIGIPIIFLSVEQDREKQLQAISEGGDDFITKPIQPEYLVTAIRMKAQRTRDMRFFMERDSLTGLLNHSNLLEKIEYEIQRAVRIDGSLTFAMIDLDHFKSVNDTYGHLTGDRVLKSLSRLLRERLRKTDLIGRYGGEEFGIILLDTTPEAAREILDQIRESFARIRHSAEDRDFYVTLSCGLASYPRYVNVGDLTEAADRALYDAKESGRNRVVSA
jgi:diguanylate cyclase (GGDEF)-like protein